MLNIVDMIHQQRTQQMNQPTPQPVDERAQIIVGLTGIGNQIFRFKNVKQAKKKYEALLKAHAAFYSAKSSAHMHTIRGDVLTTTIMLGSIITITFVEVETFVKFVPYGYGQ